VTSTLGAVAAGALITFLLVWLLGHPHKDTLGYEVAKVALQVIGVAVIGGVITVATSTYQHEREAADRAIEQRREREAEDLETRRQEFNLRADLLARSSTCAQQMYVICQHVRRRQADYSSRTDDASRDLWKEARSLLDTSYLSFNAEAKALEIELGARFGVPEDRQSGSVWVLWHQIDDLLTLYYFNLCGNFRKDVLKANAKDDLERHSGLTVDELGVADPKNPTPVELARMRNKIRDLFTERLREFAQAVLTDPLTR
jgi:hypothetical protein